MEIHRLIVPLGIATYICLTLTLITGVLIMMFHVKWVKMRTHIILGVLTLALATLHAGIVIYLNR